MMTMTCAFRYRPTCPWQSWKPRMRIQSIGYKCKILGEQLVSPVGKIWITLNVLHYQRQSTSIKACMKTKRICFARPLSTFYDLKYLSPVKAHPAVRTNAWKPAPKVGRRTETIATSSASRRRTGLRLRTFVVEREAIWPR